MLKISTHTLDATSGTHAANIEVSFFSLDKNFNLTKLCSNVTDNGGRLSFEFELEPNISSDQFQMSFNIGNYFNFNGSGLHASSVNLIVRLPDPSGHYHLPIIISPHGASLWWSK